MLAKFFQIFSGSSKAHGVSRGRPGDPAAGEAPKSDKNTHEDDRARMSQEVEQSFIGLLLGVHSLENGEMSSFEKSFLASAKKIYLGDSMPEALLPRMPMVVPRAMQALRHNDTNASELAKILSSDIVLVSDLIRLSNSAFYARGKSLNSVEDAIVNIGFKGIRQLVIGAAMKPILSASVGHLIKISSRYLWDTSMRAGLLSDAVAAKMNENRFHAYLASMTAYTGMAVLIQHLDHHFNDHEVPRTRAFMSALNRFAAEVTVRISQQWELPEAVIRAQQEQFTVMSPYAMTTLGQITYHTGMLVKVRTLKANGLSPAKLTIDSLGMGSRLSEVYAQLEAEHLALE